MKKFLRRLFVLLVLFTLIFVIFRITKPDATKNFVDKIKNIPHTISGRFGNNKTEITINDNTLEQAQENNVGNGEENNTNIENIGNTSSGDSYDDYLRLEELNNQIEEILKGNSGGNESGTTNIVVNTGIDVKTGTGTEIIQIDNSTGDVKITEIKVECNTNCDNCNTDCNNNTSKTDNSITNTNSTQNNTKYGSCGAPFTQAECNEIEKLGTYFH